MKTNKMKKTNGLKATAIFFVICLVSGLIIGLGAGLAEDYLEGITLESIMSGLRYIGLHYSVYIFIALIVLSTAAAAGFYFYAKRNTGLWDNEDDEFYNNKIDIPLSYGMAVLNFMNIFSFVLTGLYYFGTNQMDSGEKLSSGIVVDILYLLCVILTTVIQPKIVSLLKKTNPEKKGNPLSITFQKDWENSLDEAEKLTLYKTGYHSYQVTSYVCLIIMTLSLLSLLMWSEGIICMMTAALILLIQTTTFQVYALRENKKDYRAK